MARDVRRLRIADEQIAHEEAVPGELRNHAHRQPVIRIGAGEDILNEDLASLERAEQIAVQRIEACGVHRPVHRSPRNVRLAGRLAHHELVVWRAARMQPGAADEGASGRDHTLLTADRFLVERGGCQVPAHPVGANALGIQAASALDLCTHPDTPKICRSSNIRRIRAS